MESTLTTKDAFKQIIKCSWVILVNTWNSLNKAVHKYPWVFIISILIASSIISIVNIGKAGRKRHMGFRPTVRGSVMNPCDHPHGGGEGRSPIGRPSPVTPWGKPALGYKTRKNKKYSDRFIIKRRNDK